MDPAVENAIGPEDAPDGMAPPNTLKGADFRGATNSPIRRDGRAGTHCNIMHGKHGARGGAFGVNNALWRASKTTGLEEHPTGGGA